MYRLARGSYGVTLCTCMQAEDRLRLPCCRQVLFKWGDPCECTIDVFEPFPANLRTRHRIGVDGKGRCGGSFVASIFGPPLSMTAFCCSQRQVDSEKLFALCARKSMGRCEVPATRFRRSQTGILGLEHDSSHVSAKRACETEDSRSKRAGGSM